MKKEELTILQDKRAEYMKLEIEAIRNPEKYKYTSEQYHAMYDAINDAIKALLFRL